MKNVIDQLMEDDWTIEGRAFHELLKIANENRIIIKYEQRSSATTDIAVAGDNVVYINLNFFTNFSIVFRLAHELAHLLYGDVESQQIYAFSPLSEKYEEQLAHLNASKMLASLMYYEVPMSNRNYINFMNQFTLPSSFEKIVKEAIESV